MALLLSFAALALIYHLWSKVNWMESVMNELTARVHSLEQSPPLKPVPHADARAGASAGPSCPEPRRCHADSPRARVASAAARPADAALGVDLRRRG